MTGMTPAWLTFSGMYVDEPPNILRPTIRRAYCTGIRRWPCSMKITAAMMTRPIASTTTKMSQPCEFLIDHRAAGNDETIEVKIRIDMPLPIPRSVISSPNHMIIAVPAVITMTINSIVDMLSLTSRVPWLAEPWKMLPVRASATMPVDCKIARPKREIAGVLGDLGGAGLAFLLQGLQARDHHGQQLQDDAGGDVGHDAEREDRQLQQRAAGEQVDQAVDAGVVGPVDALLDLDVVDAGRRDGRPEPEEHDDEQHEQQLAAQVRCSKCIDEGA